MTKQIEARPVPLFAGIRCERCGSSAKHDSEGFGNFVSLDFDCAWGSALGDGTHVDLDLCHAAPHRLDDVPRIRPNGD